MPEEFVLMQCSDKENCEWDEQAWHHELDPQWSGRPAMIKNWQMVEDRRLAQVAEDEKAEAEAEAVRLEKEAEAAKESAALSQDGYGGMDDTYNTPSSAEQGHSRRQLLDAIPEMARVVSATHRDRPGNRPGGRADMNAVAPPPTKASESHAVPIPFEPGKLQKIKQYVPPKPPSHKEFIDNLMNYQHLYPGVLDMRDKRYLLRPEAIESVFYMHRITGDPKWREYGWKMWQSVEKMTRYEIAYSSVMDVTAAVPYHTGGMESFWTAETLKYFYLLFEDEGVASLDEYVYNTEAHPLLRPDAKLRKG
jgi:mannosyl-oligosaccharide alpha-1,2-mannosidase